MASDDLVTKEDVLDTIPEKKPTLMYWLRHRKICINVGIMTFMWLSGSFNYYLIQFLINTFEEVYVTAIGSSVSDIIANVISAIVFERVGIRGTLSAANAWSTLGGVVVLFYGLHHQQSWTFPIIVMLTKFGVSITFNVLYISHSTLFPVLFAATALGMCNFIARLFSALSSLLAEMEEPLPMIVFSIITCLTCILSLFIQTDAKKSVEK